jgi:nucleotide-binding universal stress UspA family protein
MIDAPAHLTRGMEIMIRKIVVAYDGSTESENAYKLAVDLSKRYSARMIVLAVVQPPQPYADAELPAVIDTATDYFQANFKCLREQAATLEIAADFVIRIGHPAEQIVILADEEKADAIVVGHRGQSRLQRWLLGSVAKRVLAYAKCHVFVAR